MKVFPVDSIVTRLGDDGLPIYDRPYVSADLREVYANFFSNGVFMDDGTALQVKTATGGMNVVVKAGSCHMNGAFGFETVDRTLQINAADNNLDRIDTVVARLDLGIDARSIDLYVLKGTPAADPVRRNLTRNETVWELGLADIYVPKGIDTISQARISDTRLETKRCGAVTPFAEFDTTALYDQLKQATADAVDAMQDALDGTTAGNLQHYRRSLRVETEIPSGADLNTYQTAGNFGCSVVSNVTTIANKPSGLTDPFLLFVHAIGDSAFQEVVDSKGSRWCRDGVGDWVRTFDSSKAISFVSRDVDLEANVHGKVNGGMSLKDAKGKPFGSIYSYFSSEGSSVFNIGSNNLTEHGDENHNMLSFVSRRDGSNDYVVTDPSAFRNALKIQRGQVTKSIEGGVGYYDVNVTFPTPFANNNYSIVLGSENNQEDSSLAGFSVVCLTSSKTSTGFTVRIFKNVSTWLYLKIDWIAID